MTERWRVSFDEKGRDGYVHYEEGGETLSFYWAIGAGDVVASISVGDETEWRANYPDFVGRRDEIVVRIAEASIRERTPTSRWAIDETGRFLNFIAAPADAASGAGAKPTPAQKRTDAAAMVWRLNEVKRRMGMIVLILILLAGGALLAGRSAFTIKTTGTPVGASARAGDFIATPISRLQPYVPSLNRDHSRDKYSVGLLIHSAADPKRRDFMTLATDQSGGAFGLIKISGVSGDLIWVDAPETAVVNAKTGRRLSLAEAGAAPPPPRPAGAAALAALATAERRLEGMLAAPGEAGAPAGIDAGAEIFNAAFLRAESYGAPLTFRDGDFLAVFWAQRYRDGAFFVARIAPSGAIVWRTETALGALGEALPDATRPAFVGRAPRIEGKVSEPLLVVIDAETGKAETHSLLVD
ncbi:MAG: hypothetical protein R2748_35500 [Bryobacterales bacterium]